MLDQVTGHARNDQEADGPDIGGREYCQSPQISGAAYIGPLRLRAGNDAPGLAIPVFNQGLLALPAAGVAPTVQALSEASAATALSCVPLRSACRSGPDTLRQVWPSQCSMTARSVLGVEEGAVLKALPTAQASVEETVATPERWMLVRGGVGLFTGFQI